MSRYGIDIRFTFHLHKFLPFDFPFSFWAHDFLIVSIQEYRLFPELHASPCLRCHQWIDVLFAIRKLTDITCSCALSTFYNISFNHLFPDMTQFIRRFFGIDEHMMRSSFSVCLIYGFCTFYRFYTILCECVRVSFSLALRHFLY